MHKKLWNKDYTLLLQGNAISTIGDVIYSVAIGFWVYQMTQSSALMGLMSSVSMFVTMILSPFCGSIVDKCNRKWLIVGIDVVQGLLMLMVGVLAYMNALNVPIVLIVALLASFGSVFYSPAISTIMLDIIPRDDMVRGQSIHSGISSLISLVGSAFGGAMVAFLGVPLVVIINGISNLYSACTELFVTVPKTAQQGNTISIKSVAADMSCAVKTIFSDACLKIFVPCAMIINLLAAGPLTLTLPFCIEKGFTVDMYGYLISIFSAAYVLGALILGAIRLNPTNNPDQVGVSYMTIQGVPHHNISKLNAFFEPYRQARHDRNRKMLANINALLGMDMDYERDVLPLTMAAEQGGVTERHLMYALAIRLVKETGRGQAMVSRLEEMGIALSAKQIAQLMDESYPFYEYDLLGILKSAFVPKIYIEADAECPRLPEVVKLCREVGAYLCYAYLGDVADSVTGDKKAQKFEDDYLEDVFECLKQEGVGAVTYMPTRNTMEQLLRLRSLCDEYGMFQISGEDINTPRQSFVIRAMENPLFANLIAATWKLIEHEKNS